MKVFINDIRKSKEWHSWAIDIFDDENIGYIFREEDDGDEDLKKKKDEGDFILYLFNEDTEVSEHIPNLISDSEDYPLKTLIYTKTGKMGRKAKQSTKDAEKKVKENHGKICNDFQHVINYIKKVDRKNYYYDRYKLLKESNENPDAIMKRFKETKDKIKVRIVGNPKVIEKFETFMKKLKNTENIEEGKTKHHIQRRVASAAKEFIDSFQEGVHDTSDEIVEMTSLVFSLIITILVTIPTVTIDLMIKLVYTAFGIPEGINMLLTKGNNYLKETLKLIKLNYPEKNDKLEKLINKIKKPKLFKESNGGGTMSNKTNKIKDSKVFNKLPINNKKIKEFINEGNCITKESADVDYLKFKKSNHPFRGKILNEMDDERIEILYMPTSSLSKSFIFIPMFKNADDYKLIINATTLAKEDTEVVDGEEELRHEFMHDDYFENLVVAGYATMYAARKPTIISQNYKVRKAAFELYAEMMLNTLNRMGSIGTKSDNSKIVRYILARHLHQGMMDKNYNDSLDETCRTMAEADGVDKIEVIKLKFNDDVFEDIETTLEAIDDMIPPMEVDLPSFMKMHNYTFGEMGLLAIDYVPYLVALAFSQSYRFSIYSSSRNIKKTLKLEANGLQTELLSKLM